MKPDDIATATAIATTHFHTFSSNEVTHLTVRDGSVLPLSDDLTTYLYRAELRGEDNDEGDDGDECVGTTLSLRESGIYLIVATEERSRVKTVISSTGDPNEDSQLPTECFVGCGTQEESRRPPPPGDSDSGRAYTAIIASGIVSLTSLVGVVILRMGTSDVDTLVQYMTTFAAGCLLGVVVFHLYHESAEYLSKQAEWVAGAYVLLGAFLSLVIEVQVHVWLGSHGVDSCGGHGHHHGGHRHHHHEDEVQDKSILLAVDSTTPGTEASISSDEDQGNTMEPAAPSSPSPKELKQPTEEVSSITIEPVAWITAIGDFFHAFTDGVVLAVAFRSCSSSLGWAVTLGIVLHEVPHRIGDFFVFLKAGMNEGQALAVNLVASLGSLLGVLVLFVLGNVSDETLGALLATGAGALLFIAMAELLPPVLSVRHQRTALLHLIWFALGGGLLWLSVFQDVECDAS
ncbi:hypothetical protein Poli38472_008166 [Pythium oligandrum]|uniref:Uncharacterized protein n=1 Tax=Pythium oligandrum TaxID=41045 RepID=A0A8K1CM07_PYTOL|nr:hypothetical protein Poli38472_008166 [Pythium oligandrum]|eukprot:TMW65524.1 hypothetical protein Poli38472_008166 [Pythium oligandrum]